MSNIKIAFWNLQNLFDTHVSEIAADLGFTPADGWTQSVYENKVANLAAVIQLMHAGDMPDLLGLCEIENKGVVEDLIAAVGRDDYEVAHDDSPDIRGIDTSLIYSREVFELAGDPVGHMVHLRYPTRDIFEVPIRVLETGAELRVFVNHWPSRRNGVYESEPFRLAVANHCGQLVDQVLKFSRLEYLAMPDTAATQEQLNQRWNRNVLLMGDFNDEPYNRSLMDFLQASSGEDHMEENMRKSGGRNTPSPASYLGRQAYLFNCMWRFLGEPDEGSHYFSGSTNSMNMLDQFILSRGLYYGLQGLKIDLDSLVIFKPEIMSSGEKNRPRAFQFTKDGSQSSGYSDHFPIQAILETL
jgi:hypothetical protein